MSATTQSSEKLSEALKLLEEAAKEKKDEIRSLITEKYTNLRSAVVEAEHGAEQALTSAQRKAVEAIVHAKEVSQEKIKQAATAVDSQVHERPWPVIGGVAAAALLLGYILGRKGKD